MAISYTDIQTSHQWVIATGLSKEQFFNLVPLFKAIFEELYEESLDDLRIKSFCEGIFMDYTDFLFFGLYSFKSKLNYNLLSVAFGLSNFVAYQSQLLVIQVLKEILDRADLLPQKILNSENGIINLLSKDTTPLIDAMDQLL